MKSKIIITVLVEDHGEESKLGTEHGLSLWIEAGDHHVLFDTGQTDLLLTNALALGVDLTQSDAIVLSHGHYDHTGGLAAALDMAPQARVFMHPEATEPKFSLKDSGTHSIGMPEQARQALKGRRVTWTATPAIVCPGISVTGQIPRFNPWEDVETAFYLDQSCSRPDPLLDDQSLWIETEQGISVVLGCAHAGVMNILQYVARLTDTETFYTVVGGMHLLHASNERIRQTEATLKTYQLHCLAPGHCTGEPIIEQWGQVFNECYSPCFVGAKIIL
jgi:7,8-dihydropterin-6-yl-methyl-4-(beta-D-ribofuranosyl)aminobenzene 5'-phosphate synthase